jgi:hypothetical protein
MRIGENLIVGCDQVQSMHSCCGNHKAIHGISMERLGVHMNWMWLLSVVMAVAAGMALRAMRRRFGLILAPLLLVAPLVAGPRQAKAPEPAPKFAVPFVEDGYTQALADAQKRDVLLFVDAWAPW